MSFSFLPTPLYIIIAAWMSIVLISYATKLYNSESEPILALGFSLISIAGICVAIAKAIQIYFQAFGHYILMINTLMCICLLLGFGIIIVLGWHKTREDTSRRSILYFSLGAVSAGIILIVFVVLKFWN